MEKSKEIAEHLLRLAGVTVNGDKPYDIQIHDQRFYRRAVTEEIALYGEMIRFLPILAAARGYRVEEIPLSGSWPRGEGKGKGKGRGKRSKPTVYLNRVLDVLTLYFLLRFTRKSVPFHDPLQAIFDSSSHITENARKASKTKMRAIAQSQKSW